MTLPYLYEHQNRNAALRANGRRFHGYPTRPAAPDLVVIHDTESVLDTVGPDGGAENVARYQSTTDRPSSYHRIIDSDSVVVTLPDSAVAFGAKGANTRGLHASLAMRVVDWQDRRPVAAQRRAAALEGLAHVTAEWCLRYGIPVRLLTRAQYLAGESGIVSHALVDPTRRSDPGPLFPWPQFLARVSALLDPTAPEGPPDVILVLEPHGSRVFLIGPPTPGPDTSAPDHVESEDERDGYLEAGVPFLNGDTPAQLRRRHAILSARGVTGLKAP